MTREEITKHLSNMLRRKSLSDKDKEAIKYAKEYIASCCVGVWVEAVDMAIEALKKEEKGGKWRSELVKRNDMIAYYQPISCSLCHNPQYKEFSFCPECGAKMEESEE